MANWCNVRLIVIGRRADVLSFSRKAQRSPSSIFEPDMQIGEGADLICERMQSFQATLVKKVYKFQVCNGDGAEHFKQVSKKYCKLCFVLVYGDHNADSFGSYFIYNGRRQTRELSEKNKQNIWKKICGPDYYPESDNDLRFWEANWEMMDLAEQQWHSKSIRWKNK